MHIKIFNTEGEYQYIIVGHNNPIRVDKRKGYGAIYMLGFFMSAFRVDNIYLGRNCGSSQALRLYWSSDGPPNISLIAGLDFDKAAAPAVTLSAACPNSTTWSISLMYLLRCLALISFSMIYMIIAL